MDWWPAPCCFYLSVMLSPSLLPFPHRHSNSASNVYPHLKGIPQIDHPTQTKVAHRFAYPELPVACPLPSRNPTQPPPCLILLPIWPQIAQSPIFYNNNSEIRESSRSTPTIIFLMFMNTILTVATKANKRNGQ